MQQAILCWQEPTATVSDLLNAFSAKYQQKLKGSTLRATDLVLTRQVEFENHVAQVPHMAWMSF